jgi:hypothetical protein
MASVGVNAELGRTGSKAISESFSTISPTIYLGKGMCDPARLARLSGPRRDRGGSGARAHDGRRSAECLQLCFTVQYSLPYLSQHVRSVGLPEPFASLIPLVEIPLSRTQGQTTGTVNPGFIWINRYGQFGIKAQIPINRASGSHVGVLAQAHIVFDDVAPTTIGKPLFNWLRECNMNVPRDSRTLR